MEPFQIKWEVYFSKELCCSSLLCCCYDSACICICIMWLYNNTNSLEKSMMPSLSLGKVKRRKLWIQTSFYITSKLTLCHILWMLKGLGKYLLPKMKFKNLWHHGGDPIYPTPLLRQDMTQGQFFKRSLAGLNSEFFLLLD